MTQPATLLNVDRVAGCVSTGAQRGTVMGLGAAVRGLFKSEERKYAEARVDAYADRTDRTNGRTSTRGMVARQVKASETPRW